MTSGPFRTESRAGQPPRAPTLPLLMTCVVTWDSEVLSRPVAVFRMVVRKTERTAQWWQGSVLLYEKPERHESSSVLSCGVWAVHTRWS